MYLISQDKAKQLFPKDTEITHPVVLKKLHEILSARGKKVSKQLGRGGGLYCRIIWGDGRTLCSQTEFFSISSAWCSSCLLHTGLCSVESETPGLTQVCAIIALSMDDDNDDDDDVALV